MRKTHALIQVILVLMDDPLEKHWGYELTKRAGVRSGVLYPLLGRMLDEGWLEDGWEDPNEIVGKRPPRRYYKLTADGVAALGSIRHEVRDDARFTALLAGGAL